MKSTQKKKRKSELNFSGNPKRDANVKGETYKKKTNNKKKTLSLCRSRGNILAIKTICLSTAHVVIQDKLQCLFQVFRCE